MIAPRAAARPGGQDDATSRASQTGAHEAHSGPEEHAPLAPTPGFRGLTPPPSFERSSTTSSPRRAPEHAGSHARLDGADPRKAAVRLPEIGAFEALEVPENARCTGREPPLFSLSGGSLGAVDEPVGAGRGLLDRGGLVAVRAAARL